MPRRVRQEHADLAILDSTGCPSTGAATPALACLSEKASLINDGTPVGLPHVLHDVRPRSSRTSSALHAARPSKMLQPRTGSLHPIARPIAAILTLDRVSKPRSTSAPAGAAQTAGTAARSGSHFVQPIYPLPGLFKNGLAPNMSLCHHDLLFELIVTVCHLAYPQL